MKYGIYPLGKGDTGYLSPDDFHDLRACIQQYRATGAPFDMVCMSGTPGDDAGKARDIVAPYAAAGVPWWLESINPWRFGWPWNRGEDWSSAWPVEAMRERVLQGPPRI
jgi:hypothetical protein